MVGVMVMRWAFLALGIGGHWFMGASRTCMGTTIPFHDWRAATNRRELVHGSRCEREHEGTESRRSHGQQRICMREGVCRDWVVDLNARGSCRGGGGWTMGLNEGQEGPWPRPPETRRKQCGEASSEPEDQDDNGVSNEGMRVCVPHASEGKERSHL
jgi:hypothetical protein